MRVLFLDVFPAVLQVILGIVFPPYIFKLDFKSKEELQLMPQTMEEHLDELEDAASLANISISSFSEDQVRVDKRITVPWWYLPFHLVLF